MSRDPLSTRMRPFPRLVFALSVGAFASVGCGGSGGDSTGPTYVDAATRALTVARAEHAVTALSNGDLLITGGVGTTGAAIASTEVIDASLVATSASPVVSAGSLAFARARHTTTLLTTGRVVAIGGSSTTAIEEFTPNVATPASGTWATAPVAALSTARSRHAAVRLLDGRVLVTGGETAVGAALASCELFASGALPVSPAAPLQVARRNHTATLLLDGRVLVVGGTDALGAPLASAELYTPATDTWAFTANALTLARALHGAHYLDGANVAPADDRVVVAGGVGVGGVGISAAELFDPATDLFTAAGSFEGPAVFDFASAVLANGQLGIAGGFTSGGVAASTAPVRESIVYQLGGAGGVGAQDIPGRRGATRAGIVASSGPSGSDLVIVGGYDDAGVPQADVYFLAIDDVTTAVADTLTDAEGLAFGVFATEFHVFQDGLDGIGDIDLAIVNHPVHGRIITGFVGNFDVDLQLDAGGITGYVEGKSYALAIDDGFVASPDFEIDFRYAAYVEGDMDVDAQDFDFDVDRAPDEFHGYVFGYDREAYFQIDVVGDHTDPDTSFMDAYWI